MATPPDAGDLRRVDDATTHPVEPDHPRIERFSFEFKYPVWTIVPADSQLLCPLVLDNFPSFSVDAINGVRESRSPPYGTVVGDAYTDNKPSICATFSRLDFRARLCNTLSTRRTADVRAATFLCGATQQVLDRVVIKFSSNESDAVTLVTDLTTMYWTELVAWARSVLDDDTPWHYLDEVVAFMIYDIHCFIQCRSRGHFLVTLVNILEQSELDAHEFSDLDHARQASIHADSMLLAVELLVPDPARRRAEGVGRIVPMELDEVRGENCLICRGSFGSGDCEDPVDLPCPCRRLYFGRECITTWLLASGRCRQCWTEI